MNTTMSIITTMLTPITMSTIITLPTATITSMITDKMHRAP